MRAPLTNFAIVGWHLIHKTVVADADSFTGYQETTSLLSNNHNWLRNWLERGAQALCLLATEGNHDGCPPHTGRHCGRCESDGLMMV